MPTYRYRCPECGNVSDARRKIAERDRAPECGSCGTVTERTPAPVGRPVVRGGTPVHHR